jgi:hypothetical protein
MPSLREKLPNIGILPDTPISYNKFESRPNSLRQAIRSMDAPQNWEQVSDIFRDDFWTDEVQGVAWDGENWIFSCDAFQKKPGVNDKAIYVFKGGQPIGDDKWICRINFKDVPHPIAGMHESDDHWGQLCYYNGFIYVSHFWENGPKKGQTNVVVFRDNGGQLQFERWIELEQVNSSDGWTGYPEFQAINPWDGKFYTWANDPNSHEFFIHNLDGKWEGKKTFSLLGYWPDEVNGAAFSPNGHLYVAVDKRYFDWGSDYKWIFYYSALNGYFLGKIPVLAESRSQGGQELEGICYGDISWPDGRKAQIHAILLENRDLALDNIFFKSFSADCPDIV